MNGSRVAAIVLRQLYLYRGSPQRVKAERNCCCTVVSATWAPW